MKNEIDVDVLRRLVRYDPESGKLFWRKRPIEFFKDGVQSAQHAQRRWNSRYAGTVALEGAVGPKGHLGGKIRALGGGQIMAHRAAWAVHHGRWPCQIDHINGDPQDNRIGNLREATTRENCRNKRRSRDMPFGVYRHRNQGEGFIAQISYRRGDGYKVQRHLGTFRTVEAAYAARKKAEKELGFHPNHGKRRKV